MPHTEIHLFDLKNLSLTSFTQILLNDYYPFIYKEINNLGDLIREMKMDHDMDILESIQQKIYDEFDELYRKEKMVLFPYLLKLEQDQNKSENCKPFKNTKVHFTSVMNLAEQASAIISDLFVNGRNDRQIQHMQKILGTLKTGLTEIQFIKEQRFYRNLKNCSGCKTI